MMHPRIGRRLSTFVVAVVWGCGVANARDLTFDERVKAQKAIEEVYWSHRVWPKENLAPKPALSEALTEADLRAKVRDYLAQSAALDTVWHRPIDTGQLQAELDRMARDTRDGATLRELFEALGNDPMLIAETLARQALASRLVHDFYAADDRFHSAIRKKAEVALASCKSIDCLKASGPSYRETKWKLAEGGADVPEVDDAGRTARLDAHEWTAQVERLQRQFGRASGALPLHTLSAIEETPDTFVVTSVLAQSDTEITTASRIWAKVPFDVWWRGRRESLSTLSPSRTGMFTLPALVVSGCTPGTWSPSAIPAARESHTAVWTGSEMIVWGGFFNGYPVHNSGRRYDPATDSWAIVSSGAGVPQDRALQSAVWTGTEMIVWGGKAYDPLTNGTYCLNTGGRYNPSTDTWVATSTGANVPSARCVHVAAWTGTTMVVWGGTPTPPPNDFTFLNSGGRYDPTTDTWTPTSVGVNTPPSPRYPATAWTGSELIIWGGSLAPSGYLNTGGRYNPSTDSWAATATGSNVPAGRQAASAVWTGGEFIVWGGYNDSGDLKTGGRYNPSAGTWAATSVGTNVATARVRHTALWTGTEMIIWGGSGVAFPNNGGRYRPSTDSWLPISSDVDNPIARTLHTAVWTGSEMIVWGGSTDSYQNSKGNTGGRYSPTTDTWVPTSTGGTPPAGRFGHSGVWTGTEMIVWGGYDYVTYKNSGGRYNPSIDTWVATSTQGAVPVGRWFHVAVWTGTEMIIWGGSGSGGRFNSGGRYNPTTDTWIETSIDEAPDARAAHSGVWTGREMIVWGGVGSNGNLNTGGRYYPGKDTWTATSTGDRVPQGRAWHTAVWTGSKMIIWGGNGSSMFDDGGRYDPRSDTWAETSTEPGVPSAREFHKAVWTGHEMIIWGGSDLVIWGLNTGGRYDPKADRWTATSTGPNVAGGRLNFASVWTGEEMIVWGGSDGYSWLYDGGRYNPQLDTWTTIAWQLGTPIGREYPALVWTGTEMILWGGVQNNTYPNDQRSYCIDGCVTPRIYYQDLDGDGYGDPTVSVQQCQKSTGYVDNRLDCDDTDPTTFPGAPEVKDGKPNNCGSSVIDEISGPTVWDGSTFSWTAQTGATGYQVIRSSLANFATDCLVFETTAVPYVDDPLEPEPGAALFYLVRSVTPEPPGNWGQNSSGRERLVACLN